MIVGREARKTDRAGRGRVQEPPQPQHRQGGLWNFLTWSFFLSQVMVAEAFLGDKARAAEADGAAPDAVDNSGGNAGGDFALDPDRLLPADDATAEPPAASGTPMTTALQSLDQSAAPTMGFGADRIAGDGHDVPLAHAPQALATDAEGPPAEAPGHAEEPPEAVLPPDTSPPPILQPVIGPDGLGDAVGGLVTAALETVDNTVDALTGVLDQTLATVVAPATQLVAELSGQVLQTVDGVTDGVVAAIGNVLEPVQEVLQPVATVVETVAAPLSELLDIQGLVGSPGAIVVPELPVVGALHLDALFADGAYTPYGLNVDAGPAVAGATAEVAATATTALDAVLGEVAGALQVGQDDQPAPLPGLLANVVDELHLRGEGLGLL